MEIEEIRACIRKGAFSVTDHALLEGFKEGITVGDMIRAVRGGKIIERYPQRFRCLVLGLSEIGLPIHVVVDFQARDSVTIVTTYIPQRNQWVKGLVRKKRKP